jgi:hypothetical protein
VRVLRHLRLEPAAHEKRGHAREHDHRHDAPVGAGFAEDVQRVAKTEAARGGRAVTRVAGVRQPEHHQDHRHVDEDVGEQAPCRPQQQHQAPAHSRPEQNGEVPAARVQPDRALELIGPDDVVDDELDRRPGEHARGAMDEQDHHRVPDGKGAGEEQETPRDRRHHEEPLGDLDQPAAIVAIGERARVDGEQQEGQPVADHGEAAERGRVESLEHDPVTDDVLDVIGHRREQRGDEVAPIGGHAEGGERKRCQTSRSLSFELTASTTITIATVTSSTVEAAG